MELAGITGGLKKLNNHNYINWKAYIECYLQGQDLWEVVGGSETTPPDVAIEEAMSSDAAGDTKSKEKKALAAEKSKDEALRKWHIKAGKAMFVLRIAVEDELLEYIKDAATPKIAWDTLAALFSKKNDAHLQ
ncbi:Peptidyl-tRNA hydrolase II domain-containing protein [Dioscorea alata]|uniref:Peptidyl-tRNA hydrolase II domain-containing protein n=1 Tax=Dioscorea alata TaxID=55571 RepID=A0ACB7WGM8_DIOAL|nr:Peptidyl-tRNA hydrolase II domain-containing protein [Dioscorea alata]